MKPTEGTILTVVRESLKLVYMRSRLEMMIWLTLWKKSMMPVKKP